jgi:methylmalonyl-CoA mutase N-terminal domain/subunit
MQATYERGVADVENYTVVVRRSGAPMPVVLYFEKEIVDGRPTFRQWSPGELAEWEAQQSGRPTPRQLGDGIEALAGVLGGTQSLHTDSFDEALALPTEKAARIALRTQQVIAHESGAVNVADPLGGSWFVESLTDEMERRAEDVFAHIAELGNGSMLDGVVDGIERGWFQGEIADAAYDFQRKVDRGEWVLVGVSDFIEGDDEEPPILFIDPAAETRQLARLQQVKADRDDGDVARALARVSKDAADPTVNLFPALLEAVSAYATVGEITSALEVVFGTWTERATA